MRKLPAQLFPLIGDIDVALAIRKYALRIIQQRVRCGASISGGPCGSSACRGLHQPSRRHNFADHIVSTVGDVDIL